MLLNFILKKRVLLKPLQTVMRYAGPKEAIFHAIIRRNLGCTHFIIGRDHAGVSNFYEKYAAQDFAKHFKGDLGIHILALKEPYYCKVCEQITSEKSCSHTEKDKIYISATNIRKSLLNKEIPSEKSYEKKFLLCF